MSMTFCGASLHSGTVGGGGRIGNGKGRPKCAQDTRPLNSNLYKVTRDERAIGNPVCGWSTPADVGGGGFGGGETLKDMAVSVRFGGYLHI